MLSKTQKKAGKTECQPNYAILAQSGGGFPDALLQQSLTACGIVTQFLKSPLQESAVATESYRLRYCNEKITRFSIATRVATESYRLRYCNF